MTKSDHTGIFILKLIMNELPGILFIDADISLTTKLKEFLLKNGFPVVHLCSTGEEGLIMAQKVKPEIILTELELSDLDGFDICYSLRNSADLKNAYIIFFAEQEDNFIKITALNKGADDYIPKPVNERLLLSKLHAYSRRLQICNSNSESINGLTIDFERFLIFIDHQEIQLSKMEFEILALFYKNPGKVFTREMIRAEVWSPHSHVNARTIDVHINKIRTKIGDSYIHTIKGVGYKLR